MLGSASIGPGAASEPLGEGGARIITPPAPWANAVGFPLDLGEGASTVFVLVVGRRGEVGVGVFAEDRSTPVAAEAFMSAGETRLIDAVATNRTDSTERWLMVRNGRGESSSECEVLVVFSGSVPSVELTDGEVALALRDPVAARASCVARAWPEDVVAAVGVEGVPIHVHRPREPLHLPPARSLWTEAAEAVVLGAAEELVELVGQFRPDALARHVAVLPEDSLRAYLRMNVVRVVRLVKMLRRRGFAQGTVLEVGAWFGSFALALRRLGYEVVACDRYAS